MILLATLTRNLTRFHFLYTMDNNHHSPAILLDNQNQDQGPETGSSVIRTGPEELIADTSDACLDPKMSNPSGKSRVRRGSPQPNFCPSPLVPEAGFTEGSKKPGPGQNAGDSGRSGLSRRVCAKKPAPQQFDPLKMPTLLDGEIIGNPCAGYTIARIPVCDSGYFGPTINLGACRLCTFIPLFFSEIQFTVLVFLLLLSLEPRSQQ